MNSWQVFRLLWLIGLGGVWFTAVAHDPGLSVAEAELHEGKVELSTAFAPADVTTLLPPSAHPAGLWTAAEFEVAKPALLSLAPSLWEVRRGDEPLVGGEPRVELTEKNDAVIFHLTFLRRDGPGPLVFRAVKLDALPAGHREYFTARDAGVLLVEKLLHGRDPVVKFFPADRAGEESRDGAGAAPSSWGFLKLGVEHIWTGYDHLLFLFGLLVVCRTFKSIVAIISCFTLAHSLTLALATLNFVNLPSRLVEPLIAASIVFVGVENLARRGAEPKGRWALTFGFGLIHGFGFASVLRELGVGVDGRGLLGPLFTFNFGVELGQVAIAGLVLPVIWRLRQNETFLRRGIPLLSAVVALAGIYWLCERTLFSGS